MAFPGGPLGLIVDPRRSMRMRLALLVAAFLFPAVIGISYFVGSRSVSTMQADKGLLLGEAATQMAAHMDAGLYERWRELQVFSGLPALADGKVSIADKKILLERLKASFPHYAWIGFTDKAGTIVAGTGGLLEGASVAQRTWFIEGSKGPHLGDVHDAFLLAKLLPKPPGDPLPLRLLDVSAPLMDFDGRFAGVLCGHLSWDWSRGIRDQVLAPLQQRSSTRILVLNREGKTVLGTGSVDTWPDLSAVPSVTAARGGGEGWLVENWPDGSRNLTGYAHAAGTSGSPGLGWIVLVYQPIDEAFSEAVLFRYQVMIVGFAVAISAALLLWWALGRTTRPLTRIAAVADRILKGEAVAEIPIVEGDSEAHTLSVSLNRLVNTLAQRNTQLEDDIRRRIVLEQDLRLTSQVFAASAEGIVITDRTSTILSVNDAFCRITGYRRDEVVGQQTSLLKSGLQDAAFYADMWRQLQATGSWRGEIWNRRKDASVYPEYLTINAIRHDGETTHYVAQFMDLSDRKAAEDKIRQLATHDILTRLPKRELALEHLGEVLREAQPDRLVSLLYVNLEGLYRVNDVLGHQGGDEVLIETAERLSRLAGPGQMVARLAGDEFLIISTRLAGAAEAETLARAVLDACAEVFLVGGKETYLAARVGLAFYPQHGDDPHQLVRNAHAAAARAKDKGGNVHLVFNPDMDAAAVERHALDAALRQAIVAADQIFVHYQPLIEAKSGRIIGAEALARWRSTGGDMVPPDRFIPLAESNGLILPLGRRILSTACSDGARFRHHADDDFVMAVNVAAPQCEDPGFFESVSSVLDLTGLPPRCLEIELTERAVVGDNPGVAKLLAAFRQSGVGLSIDDFGTGYSALAYLRRYPFTTLKIDRSFVMEIGSDSQSEALVLAIIRMSDALGLQVIAEGVETEHQRDFLVRAGCAILQGYLFGRPLPADQFLAQLSAQQGKLRSRSSAATKV
jgi:diguanylate cyclase (GGDEF)-like protein/PAS domain S-box-containing protein